MRKKVDPVAGELVLGLTTHEEATIGLSIAVDMHKELEALAELLGAVEPDQKAQDALDRTSVAILLAGFTRRLGAGITLLRREFAPEPAKETIQ